jgi:uncharacterized DUF497 family protein
MPTEAYTFKGQKFNWDRSKNLANIEKHGVSFKDATMVFFDPHVAAYDDESHSWDEERFIAVGLSENLRLLTVCHCFREDDTVVRIISARKATKQEEKLYGGAF